MPADSIGESASAWVDRDGFVDFNYAFVGVLRSNMKPNDTRRGYPFGERIVLASVRETVAECKSFMRDTYPGQKWRIGRFLVGTTELEDPRAFGSEWNSGTGTAPVCPSQRPRER